MEERSKIALFDFCETIVDFQTADRFVDFAVHRLRPRLLKLYSYILAFLQKIGIISFLSKRWFPQASINKRLVLFQLRGVSEIFLNKCAKDYYEQELRPHFINKVVGELLSKQNEGYRIILLSGGYDIYLKYFAKDFDIAENDIISTRIKFYEGHCRGTFDGPDCLGNNKVLLLEKRFERENVYSIAYSDSKSDLPMLNWADKGVIVRRENTPSWDTKKLFSEIIW